MSESNGKSSKTTGSEPGFSTLSVHAGEDRQKIAHSLTDPIVCSATYTFSSTQAIIDFIQEKQVREEYGRYGNPGERIVEAQARGGSMPVKTRFCSPAAWRPSWAC